jgi:hypothetical protein
MTAYTEEVANARIWAGFHYRFSTRAGTECESAWNKDPVFGVIGIQTGPRG